MRKLITSSFRITKGFWRNIAIVTFFGILASAQATQLTPANIRSLQQLPNDELNQLIALAQKKQPASVINEAALTPTHTDAPRRTAPKPKTGESGLQPFGYDLFSGQPSTFAPATYIPVPTDYVIGPGDMIKIQLFGNKNADYSLTVSREGTIAFPELGPLSVAGMKFNEMQQLIAQRTKEQFIGAKVATTMGNLRSIRVFVLGDVNYPGSYTVSALATMTNALFVSGGVNNIGSLRDIQLKRRGKIVTSLDLYDLLLKGDTSADTRLQPGDVIFVPPTHKTASITGPVKRPAIYEITTEKNIQDLIGLAGGLLPSAYPKEIRLGRIAENRERQLLNADLTTEQGKNTRIEDGDLVRIFSVLEKVDNIVLLSGHVFRPITSQWHEGMRLTDLIPSPHDLQPDADLNYALIVRRTPPQHTISTLSANLQEAFKSPKGAADIQLSPKDEVIIFGANNDRKTILEPILEQIELQSRYGVPTQIVSISGSVKFPGRYPLTNSMEIIDLIDAAGGLTESAYTEKADLTRRLVTENQVSTIDHIDIDLATLLGGRPVDHAILKPHDHIDIRSIPKWAAGGNVTIQGEVRFPGNYPVKENETLRDIIRRAGGITDQAFLKGAVFLRKELQQREQDQLIRMAENLETDLATLSLEKGELTAEQKQSFVFAKSLVSQLRSTEAIGRLVIDMDKVVKSKTPESDIPMKNGDTIFIPSKMHEVTILGEVFSQTSHIHNDDLDRDDYINLSGGFTSKADEDRIYIVRANGAVIANKAKSYKDVYPGDTIVVPMDVDRISKLKLWTDVSQVVYQLSLTAASLKTVGLF